MFILLASSCCSMKNQEDKHVLESLPHFAISIN